MSFADSSAELVTTNCSLPGVEYDIPLVSKFVNNPFHHPQLFLISGLPQIYKTSIAIELLKPFTSFTSLPCYALWIDCNMKFPTDLLRKRVNIDRLKVSRCRSSEEILLALFAVEHMIEHNENEKGAPLRAIVIDSMNSFFWIDAADSGRMRWMLKNMVEKLVTSHGITVIAVMDYLGNFEMWDSFETTPHMKLHCTLKKPLKGVLSYSTFAQKFVVNKDRSFTWGKQYLLSDSKMINYNPKNDFNENNNLPNNNEFT